MSDLHGIVGLPECCSSCENHVCYDKVERDHRRYDFAVRLDPDTGKAACPYYCVSHEEEDAY